MTPRTASVASSLDQRAPWCCKQRIDTAFQQAGAIVWAEVAAKAQIDDGRLAKSGGSGIHIANCIKGACRITKCFGIAGGGDHNQFGGRSNALVWQRRTSSNACDVRSVAVPIAVAQQRGRSPRRQRLANLGLIVDNTIAKSFWVLLASNRRKRLIPEFDYGAAAISTAECRVPEVDASVDHANDHTAPA